jgi:hypothetical protein
VRGAASRYRACRVEVRIEEMTVQSLDLVDEEWHRHERRRRRLVVSFPLAFAAAIAGLALLVWAKYPVWFQFTIEVGAGFAFAFTLITLFAFPTDPVRLTITEPVLTFHRRNGRSFSIRLDQTGTNVTLTDLSAAVVAGGGPDSALPRFLVVSRQVAWPIRITAEAHAALEKELPVAGLNVVEPAPVPGRPNVKRTTYRRAS